MYHHAIKEYKNALTIEPRRLDAFEGLINIYKRYKPFHPHARITIQEMTRVLPDNSRAHTLAGSAYKELGDYDDALGMYEEANRIKPSHLIHFYRADVWQRMNNTQDAIDSYKRYLTSANPQHEDTIIREVKKRIATLEQSIRK